MSMLINPYRFSGGGTPGAIPTFVAATVISGTNAVNLNRTWPAGYAVGDLGVIVVQTANQTPATPSGWFPIGSHGVGTAGAAGSTMVTLFGRYATSLSEAGVLVANPGDHIVLCMAVFRGVDSGTAVNAQNSGNGTTTSISLPGLTTTRDNCLVVSFVTDGVDSSSASRYSAWTNADLGSVTERIDGGNTAGVGGGIGAATGTRAIAGAVVSGSVTFALASTNYAAITLALQPPLI